MTTAESMKIINQKCDDRLDMLVPAEMKRLVKRHARKDKLKWTVWVKLAIMEKIEREKTNSK